MKKSPDDTTHLELFSCILVGQDKCPSMFFRWRDYFYLFLSIANSTLGKLLATLQQGLNLTWEDVYDFVNPFGDRRGGSFNRVWTFDLDKDVLFLTKKDRSCSVSLDLARERLLTLADFELLSLPRQTFIEEQILPGPYWEPKIGTPSRVRPFLTNSFVTSLSHGAMFFEGK